jgi:hypothetical protein
MIDKIKSKVTNPYLKENFTLENLSNFFANFIAGNEFVNNLEVKELADFNKLDVRESFKSKGEAHMENLEVNKLSTRALTISDNELVFDPEASLKMKDSNIEFKVKDIFEVITFMKYIVKICGSTLEKCDFDTLLKNHNANQLMQILNKLNKKQEEMQQEKLKEQERLKKQEQEELKKKEQEELKKKEQEELKRKEQEKQEEYKQKEKNVTASYKFRQNDNMMSNNKVDVMNELNNPIDALNEDYSKMLSNPGISEMFNNYYYQMPYYNNNNNLF